MLITESKITEIFFMADEFCKVFDEIMEVYNIKNPAMRRYHRNGKMTTAEFITIMIIFHTSGHRCFKHFYAEYVCRQMFPEMVS